MPATDTFLRKLSTMHVVFAVSSLALLGSTLWMMAADHNDEWRHYQGRMDEFVAAKNRAKQAARKTELSGSPEKYAEAVQALKDEIIAKTSDLKEQNQELPELRSEVKRLDNIVDLASREVREFRAYRGVARANYDLGVRDRLDVAELDRLFELFEEAQKIVDKLELDLQQQETESNQATAKLNAATAERDETVTELKTLQNDIALLHASLERIEPDSAFSRYKRKFMEWPIIDGFNSHHRIIQDWLPDLHQKLGMATTARFDRCRTCHLGIEQIEAGDVAAFPFGKLDEGKYPHPYATHPRPDVYVTAASPHPLPEFGCTSCHDGQGSGTSFTNASHTPNDPHEAHEWEKEHKYVSNHFWEYPMLPKRFREASCVKCHHSIVELGVNAKFGPTGPKVYEGWQLVRKFGCFGCHEIHGFDAGKPIGPDLRLEPPTEKELARQTADPNLVPGKMRKVGPSLKHVAQKTTKEWIAYWTQEPKRFRPTTRMPQFFGLDHHIENDSKGHRLETVELAGVAQYLIDKSDPAQGVEPLELMSPKAGYKSSVERGRVAFWQRGCLACHSHDDDAFKGSHADFGPNLSKVHAKIRSGETGFNWVYTWIRDPQRHHPRSRMPNLFLEPEGAGDKYVDPAADIAAFLLEKGAKQYDAIDVDDGVLDELVALYLSKALTQAQVNQTLLSHKYPIPVNLIKGDEIELAGGAKGDKISDDKWRQMKLNYVGRRTISRYGCYGCHDIGGFDDAQPIGTTLQDWGRKDTSKLALEHIEEYLHHHGEADGSSTHDRVERGLKQAASYAFANHEEEDRENSAAYFYESLLHHGRPGFIWQKLRDPRSYDHKKTETKGYDARLRMPKFPLDEQQIEAIATFVLGLVAEPPAERYLFRPEGPAYDRVEGERLLQKYNCIGCHMIEMPKIRYGLDIEEMVGMTRGEIVGWIGEHQDVLSGKVSADAKLEIPDGVQLLIDNATELLDDGVPADARLKQLGKLASQDSAGMALNAWLDDNQEVLIAEKLAAGEYPIALKQLLKLKAPRNGLSGDVKVVEIDGEQTTLPVVDFHGLIYGYPDPLDDIEDQEYAVDLWETLDVAGKILRPSKRVLIPKLALAGIEPHRGGDFALWLVDSLMKSNGPGKNNRFLSWQMSPPPLYKEGIKVQTPWLYQFLKDPARLRHTTVLRMPRFNMSDDEAHSLANYFAAVDGVPYPYQEIPQREPDYLSKLNADFTKRFKKENDYLSESWKLLNAPLCIKCHSVAGRQIVASTKPGETIRGPNLEYVADRLRPDWLQMWLFRPTWITPYTSMLPAFERGKTVFPELFDAKGQSQTIGVRDALMNYHRLMEREGKIVDKAKAPAAAGNTRD